MSKKDTFPFLEIHRALPREVPVPIRVLGYQEIHGDFANGDAGGSRQGGARDHQRASLPIARPLPGVSSFVAGSHDQHDARELFGRNGHTWFGGDG